MNEFVEITDVSSQMDNRPTLCADSMCLLHQACSRGCCSIGFVSSDQVELNEHSRIMITRSLVW